MRSLSPILLVPCVLALNAMPVAAQVEQIGGPKSPYVATVRKSGEGDKVDVELKDAPLRVAVNVLLKDSGLRYRISEDVPDPKLNLNIRDIARINAFRLIINQARSQVQGLTYAQTGGTLSIFRGPAEQGDHLAADPGPAVTLEFREVPLRDAVNRLFAGSKFQFRIDADVPDVPVNLVLRDVQLDSVVRLIVRQASATKPGIQYSRVGNVYAFRYRPPGAPNALPQMPILTPARRAPTAALRWPTPQGGLTPSGIRTIMGMPGDNSLLVHGRPADIQALRQLVRIMDVPRRQIWVRISAGKLSAEGQVLNNGSIRLTDVLGTTKLTAALTPRMNSDGSIEVNVDGKWVEAGSARPMQTTVRVPAGRAVQIMQLGSGARALRVTLHAAGVREPVARDTGLARDRF